MKPNFFTAGVRESVVAAVHGWIGVRGDVFPFCGAITEHRASELVNVGYPMTCRNCEINILRLPRGRNMPSAT